MSHTGHLSLGRRGWAQSWGQGAGLSGQAWGTPRFQLDAPDLPSPRPSCPLSLLLPLGINGGGGQPEACGQVASGFLLLALATTGGVNDRGLPSTVADGKGAEVMGYK